MKLEEEAQAIYKEFTGKYNKDSSPWLKFDEKKSKLP